MKDDSLATLRKAALLRSMFGGDFREEFERAMEEFGGDKNSVIKHLDTLMDMKTLGPLRARLGAWSTGLIDHNNFLEQLSGVGNGIMDSLRGGIPSEAFDHLSEKLSEEQGNYANLLDRAVNLDPETFGSERVHNLSNLGEAEWNDRLAPYFTSPETGRLTYNDMMLSSAKQLYNNNFGRKALRDNGFGENVELFDQAGQFLQSVAGNRRAARDDYERSPILDRQGNALPKSGRGSVSANQLLGQLHRIAGDSGVFRDLLGNVMFDVTDDENLILPESRAFNSFQLV